MDLFWNFTVVALLLLQVSCLVYSIKENKDPLDVLWGFSIWGVVPILFINFVIL